MGLSLGQSPNYLKEHINIYQCKNMEKSSVLGLLLFCLYTSPSGQIIHSCGIHFHCFAEDNLLSFMCTRNYKFRGLLVCGEKLKFTYFTVPKF